jgi:hypothetical protein
VLVKVTMRDTCDYQGQWLHTMYGWNEGRLHDLSCTVAVHFTLAFMWIIRSKLVKGLSREPVVLNRMKQCIHTSCS